MSPIAARSVLRSGAVRQISSVRKVTRAFEYHPHTRLASGKVSEPAYGQLAKNAAARVIFFGPALAALFSMPFIGKAMIEAM